MPFSQPPQHSLGQRSFAAIAAEEVPSPSPIALTLALALALALTLTQAAALVLRAVRAWLGF